MNCEPLNLEPRDVLQRSKNPLFSGETGDSTLERGERYSILVIEDNPDNMTTIKAILQNRYPLLEAEDGETGLKMAVSNDPSLVLLDMSLPGMDGFEVVQAIKAHDETRGIPVIAMTAHAMKGDRERMIEAGCDDYISKPVEPEEVLEKVGYWVLGIR